MRDRDSQQAAPSTLDAGWHERHTLADGTRVTLRFIRPDDAEMLLRGFDRLSPASRYHRFLTGMAHLSADMVRYLTEIDGDRHVAIVATTESLDLKSEIGLGVARFIRLPGEPDAAESAVTVIDDAQGKGLGRLLLAALARAALDRGVKTFRAEVLASNAPMRAILGEVGARVRSDEEGSLVCDIPLAWPANTAAIAAELDPVESERRGRAIEAVEEHPLRRLLRAAAESLEALRGAG